MRLLLAEDEKEMSAALSAILTHSGYDVDAVYDGQAAVEKALSQSYDCMIFDIMMPKKDGVQALKEIRDKGNMTPVIMLTAKAEIDDRITGLDAGADDYLTKPFAMGELLARMRSLTRRSTSYAPSKLTVGNVELDVEEQELACRNSIRLANKETKLMKFFMANAGKTLSTPRSSITSGAMKKTTSMKASSSFTSRIYGKSSKPSRPTLKSSAKEGRTMP